MRDLQAIDHDIALERIGWEYEHRRNPRSNETATAARRIDELLDERTEVVRDASDRASRPVDGGHLQGRRVSGMGRQGKAH